MSRCLTTASFTEAYFEAGLTTKQRCDARRALDASAIGMLARRETDEVVDLFGQLVLPPTDDPGRGIGQTLEITVAGSQATDERVAQITQLGVDRYEVMFERGLLQNPSMFEQVHIGRPHWRLTMTWLTTVAVDVHFSRITHISSIP